MTDRSRRVHASTRKKGKTLANQSFSQYSTRNDHALNRISAHIDLGDFWFVVQSSGKFPQVRNACHHLKVLVTIRSHKKMHTVTDTRFL